MAAINRSDIVKQLIPGLHKVLGKEYGAVDNEHTNLFESLNSKRSFEEEVMMTGLGSAHVKSEGGAVQFDEARETWTARYVHETITKGFAITEEAYEDNLYDTFATMQAKMLGRSMANTKQVKAANVFNFGHNTAYPGGDGVPLFSAAHPVVVGTQSNKVTTDLSEAALEQACIDISLFKDERGILIGAKQKSIHIPPALQFALFDLLRSDLSTTTATLGSDGITQVNNPNAIKQGGYFPGGSSINHRFTDTNQWQIRTDCMNGTKMFTRVGLSTADEGDFATGNIRYKARERYSFGWSDWRQWYGSDGTA